MSSPNQPILFISDLHLAFEKPKITQLFVNFLENVAINASAVYILGDLFDVWLGDDDFMPPINKIKAQIKRLTSKGVKVYLQLGNRDFLIGAKFCQQTGIILLDEYTVINLFGVKTLLMHGDLLCTDDLAYQNFRQKSHTQAWQQNVLSKPLILRLMAAKWYRLRSFWHKKNQMLDIMDVNQQTVVNTMQRYEVTRLIHGHTHRPAMHELNLENQTVQRFVLSAWNHNFANILSWYPDGYKIIHFKNNLT